MRTLFTLLFAVLCLSLTANAQRFVNLAVTTTSVTPSTYSAGQQVTISGFVQNVGTTPKLITDTILFALLRDTVPVVFSSGGTPFIFFPAPLKALNPNDTVNIGLTFTLNYTSAADSGRSLCLGIVVLNRSADSVSDTTFSNDISCLPVTELANFAANVHDVTGSLVKANTVGVYPNPANAEITLNIGMNSTSDVAIRVFDLSGRLVMEDEKGRMTKGDYAVRLNTEKLGNGLYVYQVTMGSQVETGKFTIIK